MKPILLCVTKVINYRYIISSWKNIFLNLSKTDILIKYNLITLFLLEAESCTILKEEQSDFYFRKI